MQYERWVYSGTGMFSGSLSRRVEGNSSGLSIYVNNLEASVTRPKMFLLYTMHKLSVLVYCCNRRYFTFFQSHIEHNESLEIKDRRL